MEVVREEASGSVQEVSHAVMQSRFAEVKNDFQIRKGGSDDSQAEAEVVRKEASGSSHANKC